MKRGNAIFRASGFAGPARRPRLLSAHVSALRMLPASQSPGRSWARHPMPPRTELQWADDTSVTEEGKVCREGLHEAVENGLPLLGRRQRRPADDAALGVALHAEHQQVRSIIRQPVSVLLTGPHQLRVDVQKNRGLELAAVHVAVAGGG